MPKKTNQVYSNLSKFCRKPNSLIKFHVQGSPSKDAQKRESAGCTILLSLEMCVYAIKTDPE